MEGIEIRLYDENLLFSIYPPQADTQTDETFLYRTHINYIDRESEKLPKIIFQTLEIKHKDL